MQSLPVCPEDCGAVNNMVHANKYAKSDLDAAAKTLNGGTDMELGDQLGRFSTRTSKLGIYSHSLTAYALQVDRIQTAFTRFVAVSVACELHDSDNELRSAS